MDFRFVKLAGLLPVIILVSCSGDPKVKFSQDLNQRFLDRSFGEIYLKKSDFNLKGNIRCILEFPLLADTVLRSQPFPEIESVDTLAKLTRQGMKSDDADFFQFNESGQVLRHVGLSFGSYDEVYENSYDFKGNITAVEEFDITLKRISYTEFNYDAAGRLSEFNSKKKGDRFIDRSEISYENEFMIIRFNHHLDSTRIEEYKYKNGKYIDLLPAYLDVKEEYDKEGNLVKSQWADHPDADTILYYTITKEYNENNQMVREIEYDSENELKSIETFLYDKEGILLQQVEMENGKNSIKEYDKNRNLIYSSSYGHDIDSFNHFSHYLFKNNIFGDVHRKIYLYESKKDTLQKRITNIQYEYDDRGNWIIQRRYENGSFAGTRGRIIWYRD